MLHVVERFEEVMEIEPVEDAPVDLAERIEQALALLERRVGEFQRKQQGATKQTAQALSQQTSQLQTVQKENVQLKVERDDMAKAVTILKQRNEQLHAQLENVSRRLDAAIDKIGAVLAD